MDPSDPLANLEAPDPLGPLTSCVEAYKEAVINNVDTRVHPSSFDISKPCLVCGTTGHTFDDCPTLQNIKFLRKHYISWKMFLAKDHQQQMQAAINKLQAQAASLECEDLDEEELVFDDENVDNVDTDFPEGGW